MSRIGKQPIVLPEGVEAVLADGDITVSGPKGKLVRTVHPDVSVTVQEGKIVCAVARQSKQSSALWGTTRAIIANMVRGVHEGFSRQLELQGVGYRASVKGNVLELAVGFSHPVKIEAPEGISFTVNNEIITIEGIDTEVVGRVAAQLRAIRPPEPYKGKGIRYVGERVRRKAGKMVGTTT